MGQIRARLMGFGESGQDDTHCTKEVLDSLQKRGLLDIDDDFHNTIWTTGVLKIGIR